MYRVKLVIFTLTILFACKIYSAEYTSVSGADILNIEPGARETGLGNSFIAVADSPLSIFYNDAGLANLNKFSSSIGYLNFFSELKYNFAVINFPLKYGAIGFGLNYAGIKDFYEIEMGKQTENLIGFSSFLFQTGYGLKLSYNYSLGIGLKYLKSTIGGYSANAVAFDVGLLAGFEVWKNYKRVENNLRLGVGIKNFGTKIRYSDIAENMPTRIDAGIYYQPFKFAAFTAEADYFLGFDFSKAIVLKSGIELLPDYFLTPRLGIKITPDDTVFNIGCSIGQILWNNNFKLDMAYSGNRDLGSSLYFTLNIYKSKIPIFRDEGTILSSGLPPFFNDNKKLTFSSISTFIEKIKIKIVKYKSDALPIVKKFRKLFLDSIKSDQYVEVTDKDYLSLIKYNLIKENSGYNLEVFVFDKKSGKRIKKYQIRFKNDNILDKIVKKLTEGIRSFLQDYFYSNLEVDSKPNGAEVYINGEFAGVTPLILDTVTVGRKQLVIKKEGITNLTNIVEIKKHNKNRYSFDIENGYFVPEIFKVKIVGLETENIHTTLDDYKQIFRMLLKEKSSYFSNYIKIIDTQDGDITVTSSFFTNNGQTGYKFQVDNNKTINEFNGVLKDDSEISSVCDKIINSIVEYVISIKKGENEEQSNYGCMKGDSFPENLSVKLYLANSDWERYYRTPFIATNLDEGEYRYEVYDKDKLIYRDWVVIEQGKTNDVNFINYYYDDFDNFNNSFWDKYYNFKNKNLIVKSVQTKSGKNYLYLKSNIEDGTSNLIGVTSKKFISVPFEMSIKFKMRKLVGSSLYFGICDDENTKVLIMFNHTGYYFYQTDENVQKIVSKYITSIKDEDKHFHTLNIQYDGFNIKGYIDGRIIDSLPIEFSKWGKIFILSGAKKGKTSLILDDFEFKSVQPTSY